MFEMLRKCICYLFVHATVAGVYSQIPVGIGQWRTHVPYRQATSVADAGGKIFVATNVFIYAYDKETRAVQAFDKASGLSDVQTRIVRYNKANNTLLIVYENTNLDLVKGNLLVNISDIKRKQITGEKKIYDVFFIGSLAYLSTSFGIVVLDMDKEEIKDTYRIGSTGNDVKVFSFTADPAMFYAATAEGVKTAFRNAPNLSNYSEWTVMSGLPAGNLSKIITFGNKIYTTVNDSIFAYDGNSWMFYYTDWQWQIENLVVSGSSMIICEASKINAYTGKIVIIDENGMPEYITGNNISMPEDAIMSDDGTLWVADYLRALLEINDGEIAGDKFPNGPSSTNVQDMDIVNGHLWVAPGGVDQSFSFDGYNVDGVFSFISGYWNTYDRYTHPAFTDVYNFWKVAAHSSGKVYFASWWDGLFEYQNGTFVKYNKNNSILKGLPGFEERTVISGLAFDASGNLWMTSYGAERPLLVIKPDGTWLSFDVPVLVNNFLTDIIIDDYDQKWIIIPRLSTQSILVFNHGGSIEDTTDDSFKVFASGQGAGNLPNSEVYALAKDLDGEIWIGTAQGIAVFYCPGSVFSEQGCEAQQIIVTQNGVAGYLLETERINAIAVDGANRKWVGTTNGVFVLSPDGTRQIAYYTTENSPLLSNIITSIAIDGQSGEVFIGTENGLVSIRGEAADGGPAHSEVLVFPNPVYENYEGPIAIKGLPRNASVKITDMNGHLFFETTALGGQAVWNGRNYNGERAKTGVYLIFSSNADGSSAQITKLLIIN